MDRFFTTNRIRYMSTALVQVLCGVTFLLPTVKVDGTDSLLGITETIVKSVPWWVNTSFGEMGLPTVYTAVFVIFFLLCIPLVVCSFTKKLYRWPIVLSLVAISLFTLFGAFWTVVFFLATADLSGIFSVTLTIWGFVWIILSLAQIVNLALFIPALKKA